MSEPEKPDLKTIFGKIVGGIALAFPLSFAAMWLARLVGFGDTAVLAINLAVFFTVVSCDPIALWQGRAPLKSVLPKLAGSAVLALIVVVALPDITRAPVGGEAAVSAPEAAAPPAEKERNIALNTALIVLPAFLIFPLAFLGPVLRRLIFERGATAPQAAWEDLQIAMVFPIYVTLNMAVTLGLAGAMSLLDVSLAWGVALAALGVLLTVFEAGTAPQEDLVENPEATTWGPRPKTAAKAWAGLGRAIRSMWASAFFIGSTIYLCIGAAHPFIEDVSDLGDNPFALIWSVLLMGGAVILVFIVAVVLASLLMVGAAMLAARRQGIDPLGAAELIKQAQARLFMGGMNHVRPDLETD